MVNTNGSAAHPAPQVESNEQPAPGMRGTWEKFEKEYIKPTFTKEKKDSYSYEVEQPLDVGSAENKQL